MKKYLLLLATVLISSFTKVAFALPLHHYDITKITDPGLTNVTHGKEYFFLVEGKDVNGSTPTSGNQESVVFDCGGNHPCPDIAVLAPNDDPPGSGRYIPDPQSRLTVLVRFVTAPQSMLFRVKNFNTPLIFGSMPITVQRYPTTFSITTPINTTAGVPFDITITAQDSGSNTVTSFKDDVVAVDTLVGTPPFSRTGDNFVNGVATMSVTLYAGDFFTRLNQIRVTNSRTYMSQATPATGVSPNVIVDPDVYNRVLQLFPGEIPTPGVTPGKNTSATLNQIANQPVNLVRVYATDQYFNPLGSNIPPGLNINFTSNVGGDTLPATSNLIANPLNLNNAFSFNSVGPRVITAQPSINPGNASQSTVTVVAGQVAYYLFTQQPAANSLLTADVPFTIQITAYDSAANVKTDLNGAVTGGLEAELTGFGMNTNVVDTNSATLQPDNVVTFVNGVATLNNSVLITRKWPNARLRFNGAGGLFVWSNNWSIQEGNPAQIHFTFKGSPGQTYTPGEFPGNSGVVPTLVAGSTITIEARLTDRRWNVVSGSIADNTTVTTLGQTQYHYIQATPATGDFPPTGELLGVQSLQVNFRTAGFQNLRAVAGGSSGLNFVTASANINILPNTYARMAIEAPGETLRPGIFPSATTLDGKEGTPSLQSVGVPFNVRTFATDIFYNPIQSFTYPIIDFNFQDPNHTIAPSVPMAMGASQETFAISLQSLTLPQVEVFDTTAPSDPLKRQTVSINMGAGPLHHFEMDPVGAQAAGIPFTTTIRAKDQFNNTIPQNFTVALRANTGIGTMTPSQVNLTNGVYTGNLSLFTATTTAQIEMSVSTVPAATSFSNYFQVGPHPSGYQKLLLQLPGEQLAPGTVNGKVGTPTPLTVGTAIDAIVYACDIYYNGLIITSPVPSIQFSSDRGTEQAVIAPNPINMQVVNGRSRANASLTLKEAALHNISVRDLNLTSIQTSSSSVQGLVGPIAKLQILAPGETSAPGTALGKTGSPLAQRVSVPFTVQMRTVDQFFNPVSYNGGDTLVSADQISLFIPQNYNPPTYINTNPFVAGVATRTVVIGISSPTLVSFGDRLPPYNTLLPASVLITQVNSGPQYVFQTPSTALAGQPFAPITITLEDGGIPVDYDGTVTLTPELASTGAPGSGSFSPSVFTMTDGSVTITNLNYAHCELIRIRLTDELQRLAYSNNINVIPNGLKYEFFTPATPVIAGQPFPVRVELREALTDTLVRNRDHGIDISIRTTSNQIALGTYTVNGAQFVNGVATFDQSYSKAESIILISSESVTNGEPTYDIPARNSGVINVRPDAYVKLLVIAPGETHMPGVPSATGKIGSPTARQKSIQFQVQVRGVDQFWNVVDTFNGGQIRFSSDDTPPSINATNPPQQNSPLANGAMAADIHLDIPGDTNVTVLDNANSNILGQTVQIPVGGNFYEVLVTQPNPLIAGPNGPFEMNIRLVDFLTGQTVIEANREITLQALKADLSPATGNLGQTTANIIAGRVTITGQTYSRAEDIRIRVSDTSDDIGTSSLLTFIPRQVRYVLDVPTEAEVNVPFQVTVRTIDNDTGLEVVNLNRTNNLEARLTSGGLATGNFSPATVNIINGIGQINATYDRAESIFLRLIDPTPITQPSPPVPPGQFNSTSILVNAGPIAAIDIADFTMQSNEVSTRTLVVRDGFNNLIPNRQIGLRVLSTNLPGVLSMNGSENELILPTNAQGEANVNFDPTPFCNGVYQVLLYDPNRPNGFSRVLNVTINGFPQQPSGALGLGENRIPVNSTVFLELNTQLPPGGTLTTYYRVNGSQWYVYNAANGIMAVDPARPGVVFFDTTKNYDIEWYSEVCYNTPCNNPISELAFLGGPHAIAVITYQLDDNLVGYPSPFNPKGPADENYLTIQYPLAVDSSVEIEIYDLFGQKVWHTDVPAGAEGGQAKVDNRVFWFGTNDDGTTVANGGYIVIVKVGATGQKMRAKVLVAK